MSFRRSRLALALTALVTALGCAGPGDRAVSLYTAQLVDNSLPEEIIVFQELDPRDSWLVAAAYSEAFHHPSPNRQWEWETQVVKHGGNQNHWEFNALVDHRWKKLPWDEHLDTSFALGGGLSVATELPPEEEALRDNEGANELLFYVLVEATFALPGTDRWHLLTRVHHRSGAYGTIDDVSGGSNFIAIGLRYEF